MAEAQRFVILPKHLRKKLPKECQTGCRWKRPSSASKYNHIQKSEIQMSTNSSRHIARSKLQACAFAVFTVIGMIAGNIGTANAATAWPPVVIPTVPNVSPPAGVQIVSISSTGAFVTETPNSGYVVATRYVSGPIPPFDYVFPIGESLEQRLRLVAWRQTAAMCSKCGASRSTANWSLRVGRAFRFVPAGAIAGGMSKQKIKVGIALTPDP